MIELHRFSKYITSVLPFLLLCLCAAQVNLSAKIRYRQFLMPFVALAYGIAAVANVEKIAALAVGLLRLTDGILPLPDGFSWQAKILVIANCAVLILYLPVKGIALKVLNMLWTLLEKLFRQRESIFYYYNEDLKEWVLKNNWGKLKGLYTYFYYGSVLLASLLMIQSYVHPESPAFRYRYYPVYGILVLGEIAFYFGGFTEREYREKVLGEEFGQEPSPDYAGLREKYRKIFGQRMISDDSDSHNPVVYNNNELIKKLVDSHNSTERAFAAYLEREERLSKSISGDYIMSALGMMRGKSVLYANPFYRDLSQCIFFPMNLALLKQGKALIIAGRHEIEQDLYEWVDQGMESISHVPGFWRIEVLREEDMEPDIGILAFRDLFNLSLLDHCKSFLEQVTFVVVLEPSRILAHGQMALNMIVKKMERRDKKILYCGCDRNINGLVDALSHTLKTELVEVKATVTSAEDSTCVYWGADGEFMHHKLMKNVVRYLGCGTSLAMVALKEDVKKVTWLSDCFFPVRDMKWIAGQYYEAICKYIEKPVSQEMVDEVFQVDSNIWNMEQKDYNCLIVEDEYYNLYEVGRQFASRGKKKSFINIISSNYMLRDYMCDNFKIFRADAKALAQISPDFARTRRNVVLQLIMMMSEGELSDREIAKELTLAEIKAPVTRESLEALIGEYYDISGYRIIVKETDCRDEFDDESDELITCRYYGICNEDFIRNNAFELQNAYYLGEDDKAHKHFLGGRLMGHIYQSFIPGQMFSFAGKYYEVVSVSTADNIYKNAVIVRRAADHIDDRRYYRQLRTYRIGESSWTEDETTGGSRTINQIKIYRGCLDLSINTKGYLDMKSYNDLKHAVKAEVNHIPIRQYRKKQALKIVLGSSSEEARVSITIMLNEIFRTVYPENCDYIAAVTDCTGIADMPEGMMYSLEGSYEKNCIYIIEDSQLDLGLILSVERNMKKFLEIVMDYSEWTLKLIHGEITPEPEPQSVDEEVEQLHQERAKKSLWIHTKEFLGGFFEKNENELGQAGDDDPLAEPSEKWQDPFQNETHTEPTDFGETEEEIRSSIMSSQSDLENNGTEFGGQDEQLMSNSGTDVFLKNHYLKYGQEEFLPFFDFEALTEYLGRAGFGDNSFERTRKNQPSVSELEMNYNPYDRSRHFCDFCGCDMTGVQYDTLSDGRERCPQCAASAVRTVEEFKIIYKRVLNNMEAYFEINLDIPVQVKMVDAREMARSLNRHYVPTPGVDSRAVGLAVNNGSSYTLLVENGAPLLTVEGAIAHELTHIWQFMNWNKKNIQAQYGKELNIIIEEGMAKWVEIQFLMLIGEKEYAKREEIITRRRSDEYGTGFQLYIKKYPFSQGKQITKETPFLNKDKPL